jgi:hypothetical protein
VTGDALTTFRCHRCCTLVRADRYDMWCDTCRQDVIAVADTTTGPCARCHQPCRRYGPLGSPLCQACRTPHTEDA